MITTVETKTSEMSTVDAQQKLVKDSLERAFDELHAGEVRKDAHRLTIRTGLIGNDKKDDFV